MLEAKAFLRGTSTGTAGGFPTQKRRRFLDLCIVHKTGAETLCRIFGCLGALFHTEKGRCVEKAVETPENRSSNPASCLADPGNIHCSRVRFLGIEKAETAWSSRLSAFDIQIVSAFWS